MIPLHKSSFVAIGEVYWDSHLTQLFLTMLHFVFESGLMKQITFSNRALGIDSKRREHGGNIHEGKPHRKNARPFSPKLSMHVTLWSSQARGQQSMTRPANEKKIRRLVFGLAEKFNVKVYSFANSGNHLHLLLRATEKLNFQNYLRSLTGLIARSVTRAERGRRFGKFWDQLAYSRLVSWGNDFNNVIKYVARNAIEGAGLAKYNRNARFFIDHDLLKDPGLNWLWNSC
jgi:REP element-mobilizing transposase RayT